MQLGPRTEVTASNEEGKEEERSPTVLDFQLETSRRVLMVPESHGVDRLNHRGLVHEDLFSKNLDIRS